MTNNILVIAPHPDDEVLGCGATIRKKVLEGHNVYILIMTNAHKTIPERYTEEKLKRIRDAAKKAHNILGTKETFYEDFPALMLDQYPLYKIAEAISSIIKKKNIDTVYIPHHGDIHIDHKIVFNAAMVACRPIADYSVKRIFAYETLSETEWANPYSSDIFVPSYFETITIENFNYKCEAMKCYASQLKEFPAARSIENIEALAKFRGASINVERAESFSLIRMID
jgi:LmbE family N-acetylglucosaminyl deacetylase